MNELGILLAIVAYVVGSLPITYAMTRYFAGVDLHEVGSGSVGATNVARNAGPLLGILALAIDMGKGALVAWIAANAGDIGPIGPTVGDYGSVPASPTVVAVAGVAVIVGHVFPIGLAFRGGKGVATSCGVFAVIAPHAALLSVVAFAIVAWTTRYVSLGSLAGAVVLPLACAASAEVPETLLASCAAAIVIVLRHRENLNRLHAGTEPRFGRQFTERS